MFILHPTLAADTIEVGDLPLCKVLLMNNAHLPWLILVPRRANISELYELDHQDQQQAYKESITLSQLMMSLFEGDKLNTAALGNMVPQLHLHHIVRYQNDPCWPKPVWGLLPDQPYNDQEQDLVCQQIRQSLSTIDGFNSAN